MIVFGHNSFLLHGCKPSELGMPVEIDNQYRIERRQRYVHLFWIPTFGIGKIWVLRDLKSDQLFEPNMAIGKILNSLPLEDKTPWYTFALPLLALVAAIVVPIGMKISDYASQKKHEAYVHEKNEAIKKAIETPSTHQYFELRDDQYNKSFLKVVGSDNSTLRCVIITGDYDDPSFLAPFARNKGQLDTISLRKDELIKNITEKLAILPDGNPRIIEEKYEYNDALFHSKHAGFQEGIFAATIQNLGADVTLVKSATVSGNLSLNPLPGKIDNADSLQLVGTFTGMEPQYQGLWTFKNKAGETRAYDVYINSARIFFNKK
ncbi:hypothetical protein [Pseudochryseolinea flava]|uniref:Uncharacterized protein n=1 Tax=Pseudochryseolinea flava TaxID=2059302 RepID=A0A364Y124_9BACT|nr:hypothetical protein [Pseudochryseolinea flava]RAW00375.1 hypothetical protein DQQ10_15090 [Pseudochryseolinea flava]